MRKIALTAITTLAFINGAVDAGGNEAPATASRSIAAIVASDPNFSTLLTAVRAAGLTETLASEGPFTVFAPTNAAFAKVPRAQLNALLNDPERLREVLLYHVVPGRVTSAEVVQLDSAETALGAPVNITAQGNTVRINDARVTAADVRASNGVIHVIDQVLLPPQ